jgi:hypothetical protein
LSPVRLKLSAEPTVFQITYTVSRYYERHVLDMYTYTSLDLAARLKCTLNIYIQARQR